ncbi:MAG: response regulator [Phycisphaerae bacterium]
MNSDLAATKTRRIVVLARTPGDEGDLVGLLNEQAEPHVVRTADEAVAALRSQDFDGAVAESSELLALARSAGQFQTETILEAIGHPVCIVGREGEITWSNRKFKSYASDVAQTIRDVCGEICRAMSDGKSHDHRMTIVHQTITVGRDHTFDLTGSPLLADDGQVDRFLALLWDASGTRRLQEKLNAIDNAGRDLLGLDKDTVGKMEAADRLKMLEEKVVAYSHDLLDFDHLIVRVLDERTNRLDTVMARGISEEAAELEILVGADGNGISGYVAATGRSYLCPDTTKDPRYLKGLDNARSSLTVPLKLQQRVIGILNVESDRVSAFSEDDRQFAEIFARYIAMALQILQLLVGERYATTGQLAADVDAEVKGPLNDILRDVSAILEKHSDNADLKTKLQAIITDVDRVKQAVHRATDPSAVSGLRYDSVQTDPVLRDKRILIADDEDIIRETVAEVLGQYGALPVMARDGNEAIAMLKAQTFDLVLSDIKMPSRNGYEVFSAARAANQSCPVILITGFGYDPNHSIVRASKEGLSGVLFKPFKVDQLLEEVRAALIAAASN